MRGLDKATHKSTNKSAGTRLTIVISSLCPRPHDSCRQVHRWLPECALSGQFSPRAPEHLSTHTRSSAKKLGRSLQLVVDVYLATRGTADAQLHSIMRRCTGIMQKLSNLHSPTPIEQAAAIPPMALPTRRANLLTVKSPGQTPQ